MSISKKTLVTLLACLMILLSFTTNIFADDVPLERERSSSVTYSERDMIKSLQAKTNAELNSMGYSSNEILQIRSLTDEAVVDAARKQSNSELMERGLTKKQIDIIRNESSIQKAAKETFGSVTYTVAKVSYKYSSSKTELTMKATWKWSTSPLCLFTDIIACTTSQSAFTKVSGSGSAKYSFTKNGKVVATHALAIKTESSGTGAFARIDLAKTYTGAARPTKMTAFEGDMMITFEASKKISSVGISTRYGHASLTVTPSITVSKPGALAFTPSYAIDTGDEAYLRLTL